MFHCVMFHCVMFSSSEEPSHTDSGTGVIRVAW